MKKVTIGEVLSIIGIDYVEKCRDFADWDVTSHCGRECMSIIDGARNFTHVCDPCMHKKIWDVAMDAMCVICNG